MTRIREPKLLACDIDGTLLDQHGVLRPAIRGAVAQVRAAGIKVVLATGRSPWGAVATAHALGLTGPQITMNGGAYVSPLTGHRIWARRMTAEQVIDVLAFARGIGASPLLGFLNRHACERVSGGAPVVPDFAVGPRLRQVDCLADLAEFGPIRMYIPVAPSRHAAVLAEARDWFGSRASVVYGDLSGIEIMTPGTNKGEALRAIAASMGLSHDRVAAIGDAANDREMLAFAGCSAAMLPAPGADASAGLAIGEATHVVPSSAHDGAREALRRFFPSIDFDGTARVRSLPRPDRDLTAA